MLHVLICEDDPQHREHMESIVIRHITTEDVEMELVLSAGCPTDVLDHLEEHPDTNGLYFLDVDLQHDMSGIELATKIKEIDASAIIVFVTTHEELSYLVFRYRIEALDYIIKDRPEDVETRAAECMLAAYKRYLDTRASDSKHKYYHVKAGDQIWNIPYDEILFFETDPTVRHKMILHMENSRIKFRGFISEVAKIGPEFYRCHKSFVVNIKNIRYVDRHTEEIEMKNGNRVPITVRKIPELLRMIG